MIFWLVVDLPLVGNILLMVNMAIIWLMMINNILVGWLTCPSGKHMSSSGGIMLPNIWKINPNVPRTPLVNIQKTMERSTIFKG